MQKLKIIVPEYYTYEHKKCVIKTIELLRGVTIINRSTNEIEIECDDESFQVISNMDYYDYLIADRAGK